ncbi:MAG: molybdopterin-dependent oxidoreductase [Cyanobacteria bacterium J06649_5]
MIYRATLAESIRAQFRAQFHVQWSRAMVCAIAVPTILGLVGCGGQPNFEAVYTSVTPATIQPGDPIPDPTGEPVIVITGRIQSGQPPLKMDQASLDRLMQVEYTVLDPFEKENTTFRGILFRDLLDLWQVDPEATCLTMTALNDYEVQIPIALLREYPVMFAQQQNGEMMTRDYRGPAMLVAPTDQYPSVKALAQQDYWIWQIATIHVE